MLMAKVWRSLKVNLATFFRAFKAFWSQPEAMFPHYAKPAISGWFVIKLAIMVLKKKKKQEK